MSWILACLYSNCIFEFHIQNVCKKCSNLSGWILRTFTTRDSITMITLFKSLVLPRLDYGSHDGIGDSEIQIPEFSITRCDRLSRVGGGVCIYLRNSVNFITCVNYSNSACDLLIIKINHPSLIVILIYRPPSCTTNEFNDIIVKVNQFIFSLSSPLPNIIILGDFNLPGVDWLSPNMSSMTTPLVDLCDYLFLNQQVHKPTRK